MDFGLLPPIALVMYGSIRMKDKRHVILLKIVHSFIKGEIHTKLGPSGVHNKGAMHIINFSGKEMIFTSRSTQNNLKCCYK